MRILLVTYYYQPANNPRAFRWTAICEYWEKKGVLIDVVCVDAGGNLASLTQCSGIKVYPVRDLSYHQSKLANTTSPSSLCWRGKIKQSLRFMLKKIVVLLRWPDYAWLWIPSATHQAKHLLKTRHYDGIISVAIPFSSHIVALLLAKHRKGIPWICDYGDPFSFMRDTPLNNRRIYSRLNKWVERTLNQRSQKLSVTTLETAQEHERYLNIPKQWLHVIPPLAKKNHAPSVDSNQAVLTQDDSIHLVFAGVLYSKIRNPAHSLSVLSRVREHILPRKFVVHFYGELGGCEQEFLPYKNAIGDWICLHGVIEQSELWHVYEKADILINIGNATAYQAPSKVIEYMSTGLPILNITSIRNDSSTALLESYPAKYTLFEGDGISEKIISELCIFIGQSKQVDAGIISTILQKYQIEAISKAYLELLVDDSILFDV